MLKPSGIIQGLKRAILGYSFCALAIGVLFWNERWPARCARAFERLQGETVSIPAEGKVDPRNDRSPIHIVGQTTGDEVLADGMFPVSAAGLVLRRKVEMYQWSESEGGGEYAKVWSEDPIDSEDFAESRGHGNPSQWRFGPQVVVAEQARLGSFRLDPRLLRRIRSLTPLPVEAGEAGELAGMVVLHEGGYYLGKDPAKPEIGDLRVAFEMVPHGLVSVLGRQRGDRIQSLRFFHPAVAAVLPESHERTEMFAKERSRLPVPEWRWRLVGWLLLTFGLHRLFTSLRILRRRNVTWVSAFASAGICMGIPTMVLQPQRDLIAAAVLAAVVVAIAACARLGQRAA